MASNKIVIELVAKDQASKEFIGASRKIQGTLKEIEVTGKKSIEHVTRSLISFKNALIGITTISGTYGLSRLASSAIETAAGFEQMEIKLNALTKGRGKEILNEINKWALEMPVNTRKAIDTFVMMKAMGLDPVIKSLGGITQAMEILVDVGSIFGEEAMPRVARALGQMVSLGKLSAEELNQLSEAGINARKYLTEAFGMTVEELKKSGKSIQEIVLAIAEGMKKEFGGAARASMDSWQGVKTEFASIWTEIEREFMEAGVFDAIKNQIKAINLAMKDWLEQNRDLIRQEIPQYCNKIVNSLKTIADILGDATLAVGKFIAEFDRLSKNPLIMGLWGAALGSRAGPYGAIAGGLTGSIYGIKSQIEEIENAKQKTRPGITSYGGKIYVTPQALESGTVISNIPKIPSGPTLEDLREKYGLKAVTGFAERITTDTGSKKSVGIDIDLKTYEDLAKATEQARKDAERASIDAWKFNRKVQSQIIELAAIQEKYRLESITKTSSMLEELLESDLLTQEERLRYAEQYGEARIALIQQEVEELRKLAIPEDVLESYRRLQEEAVKTQIETMEMGGTLSRFIDETFTQMARDMQSHVSDSLYAIATQSENMGDVLQNIHNSVIRMMCDLSAKMITDWAANALKQIFSVQSALSGTAGIGGWLGKAVGFIGGLFGGGGGAAAGSTVSSNIARLAGAQFQTFGYAQGGIIPGHLNPIVSCQHGNIFDKPTLAYISEYGQKEAVFPLTRTSGGDLGIKAVTDTSSKEKERPINVNVHIHTQDVESFRESRNQISTQMITAIRRAMRDV